MSSDERSPAKSECLEEEPEVHRVEVARVIPARDIRIEPVIITDSYSAAGAARN